MYQLGLSGKENSTQVMQDILMERILTDMCIFEFRRLKGTYNNKEC